MPRKFYEGLTPCPSPKGEGLYPRVLNAADPILYKKLYEAAKKMRNNPTLEEKILWQILKKNKGIGKFRRQHIIDTFIVDFYCVETGVVIEVDGGIHMSRINYDNDRDNVLAMHGCSLLRFKNEEVLRNQQKVLSMIEKEQLRIRNTPRL